MKLPLLACLVLCSALGLRAADSAPAATIKAMLTDFLTDNHDPAQHESFWAEDLIYTSSAAAVRTKAEIMASVRADAAKPDPAHPAARYSAEDVVVRVYGDFAALTFRLVARHADGSVDTYRNSGAFLRREGRWQAVTWQATKVPPAATN